MFVTLARIIKYGWQGFLRNGWLSVSTISIMFLAGVVFEGLILFNVVAKTAISSLQDKIDISVYFKSNAPEDSILNIKRSLEGLTEVKGVDYISQDEALVQFKAKHAGEETVTQTLSELDVNPLLASLNVKAKDPSQYQAIADYLNSPNLQDLVGKVTYAQNQVVINRLNSLVSILKNGGFILTLFLAFLAVAVTFNTIRLAIFSNSDQIGIMRLVGASNAFIRGPYVFESVVYGLIAGTVGFLIFIPLINFVSPYVNSFIQDIDLNSYFSENFLNLFLYQLLFSIGLGIVSSVFAIRKYLRV
ncbi:MAG: hypothetical protein UY23_C0001G0060 [Candidatus Jorgensenbacteria bacterium GW2011_GWA1_48_11]|uniref:Cell division protein FtsX n=1 Tax=Candidatus Jorgensenbacteria bacterium GW2011_GWA1_48_11 TaxID=1618660 RepID=A0A0G1UBG1_9BACT|nr:MAG: hypothetical protein UY23_C0001G0060 [Candidatus Jorgensenbacteria bacterium GW2011_GWA1_48_11]KKW11947.1 MAG: hypothetical protein UY51_C0005G0189 [Candidatus Jorgensenbacteria bacterium GW2011_GWB1_49_9]